MLLFSGSKKTQKEKIIALLDIENASVGVVLVRLPSAAESTVGQMPGLFGEKRIALPVPQTLDVGHMVQKLENAVYEALVHARAAAGGELSHLAVFLGAPWSTPVWKASQAGATQKFFWEFEPYLQKSVLHLAQDMPVSFHAFGMAATSAIDAVFDHDDAFFLCVITGEVCEILYIQNNIVAARATVPFGAHTLSRTVATHAGVPLFAARSAIHLVDTSSGRTHPGPAWIHEPLSVAATHFATYFADAARDLYTEIPRGSEPAHSVLVVAQEPLGELFASILGNSAQMSELFPRGGVVRALRAHHLVPHAATDAAKPDLHFMIEALFINKHAHKF